MNIFWHLVKYNLIFNKVRLAFLMVLSVFIILVGHYFYEAPKEMGEAFMQYSFYIMFMIFTGKTTSKNGMMFDVKFLVGLPLSKRQLVILKSIADTFQMFPIMFVFLYGVSLAFPDYHIVFISLLLFIAITFGNIMAFNKRIDFSRIQHSKASFKNSFLYLHKYIDTSIQMVLVLSGVGIIFTIFSKNIFMQEYSFFIFLVVATFLASSNALKMLKDETMSYFIMKRDVFRIGIKLIIVIVPLLIFHHIYKGDKFNSMAKDIFAKKSDIDKWKKTIFEHIVKMKNLDHKDFFTSLMNEDQKAIEAYLKEGKNPPWEVDIMGNYPIHLSIKLANKDIIETLLKQNPEMIYRLGKINKTPNLFLALRTCNLDLVEFLIKHKADLNASNIDGDTPLITAAKANCYGGVIILQKQGADLALKNKEGHDLFDYINSRSGIPYLLGGRPVVRKAASEEEKVKLKD